MPRYITSSRFRSPKHDKFVKKLVREFTPTSDSLQPLILEEEIPSTKSRHVKVIWDAWKELSDEERANVIVEAYQQVEGADVANAITIAEGATPQEALVLGMLPYKVLPVQKKQDAIPPEAYRQALENETPNTLLGPKARELRYARLEDAEQARKRLQEALPGSTWAVVQEVGVES